MAGRAAGGLYRSRAWKAIRRKVFERDGWRCRQCGKAGRLEVDHIKPVSEGGSKFDMENLRTLCRGCHIELTARFNRNRKAPPPERAAWDRLVEAL